MNVRTVFTLHLGETQKKVHVPLTCRRLTHRVERWLSLSLLLPPAIPRAASSVLRDEPQWSGASSHDPLRAPCLSTLHIPLRYLSVASGIGWPGRGCRQAKALASQVPRVVSEPRVASASSSSNARPFSFFTSKSASLL